MKNSRTTKTNHINSDPSAEIRKAILLVLNTMSKRYMIFERIHFDVLVLSGEEPDGTRFIRPVLAHLPADILERNPKTNEIAHVPDPEGVVDSLVNAINREVKRKLEALSKERPIFGEVRLPLINCTVERELLEVLIGRDTNVITDCYKAALGTAEFNSYAAVKTCRGLRWANANDARLGLSVAPASGIAEATIERRPEDKVIPISDGRYKK